MFWFLLAADHVPDFLTCGVCLREFPLTNIVEFIFHKTNVCINGATRPIRQPECDDDESEDEGMFLSTDTLKRAENDSTLKSQRRTNTTVAHSSVGDFTLGVPVSSCGGERQDKITRGKGINHMRYSPVKKTDAEENDEQPSPSVSITGVYIDPSDGIYRCYLCLVCIDVLLNAWSCL